MDHSGLPNWDDMRVLLCFWRAGSTLRAASQLGVSHQTVSRRLGNLETSLGARLVDRNVSPWQLTLTGEKIAHDAQDIETVMLAAGQSARQGGHDMSGRVRITSVHLGFELLLMPALQTLQQKFPLLEFDLASDDTPANIQSGNFDIAVRFTNSPPPHLLGCHVGDIRFGLYGRPDLIQKLEQGGGVQTAPALPYVGLVSARAQQIHRAKVPFPTSKITNVNDLATLVTAVSAGMGIGFMPDIVGQKHSHLVASKTVEGPQPMNVWILRNEDSRGSAKIRAIEASLADSMRATLQ
ncbi:MAG: LysR family transcriptional regulator [Rhodobacteraceae bacterium]|nr:LysR family transcriptional regulator [Paracoccaceae bacterium]